MEHYAKFESLADTSSLLNNLSQEDNMSDSLSLTYLPADKQCMLPVIGAEVRLFPPLQKPVAQKMSGGIDPVLVIIGTIVTLGLTIYQYFRDRKKESNRLKKILPVTDKSEQLHAHSNEFKNKEILTIEKNIHVAIGFGLANAILIEGEDGCILIDTLESCQTAEEVKKQFAAKTSKPIKAIILTHFHPDHTYGIDAFIKDNRDVEVYAHESLQNYFEQLSNVRSKITSIRSAHQFGTQLKYGHRENAGIGFELKFGNDSTMSTLVCPTHTFKDRLRVTKFGVELELLHAPGETNDQIIVWLPKRKILFPADNIYRAFPNLYAIRGTMSRDTMQWVRAVDLMRQLGPRVLVPQHTQPIFGEDAISEILTAYRDAIQYVHDQTVRYMNKGWTPNAIAHRVHLPKHLASHPFLQQFYGTVEWSVRAVFDHYMGWFSGSAVDLHPMEAKAKADRLVELAGGPDSLLDKCKSALANEDFQWSLELSDTLVTGGHHVAIAKEIKCMSLRRLAAGEISACGRNWYQLLKVHIQSF